MYEGERDETHRQWSLRYYFDTASLLYKNLRSLQSYFHMSLPPFAQLLSLPSMDEQYAGKKRTTRDDDPEDSESVLLPFHINYINYNNIINKKKVPPLTAFG